MTEKRKPVIFEHDVMGCSDFDLGDSVAGVRAYGSRVLASSRPGDIVLLHRENEALLHPLQSKIIKHYQQVGLEVGEIIWVDDFAEMQHYLATHEPSFFFYGKRAHSVVHDHDYLQIVRGMNDKNFATQMAFEAMGVPSPLTLRFCGKEDIEDVNVFNFPSVQKSSDRLLNFPVVFKPATGASGIGIEICKDRAHLEQCIAAASFNFQIQQFHPSTQFLNLQYRVIHGKLERFIFTEQILEGSAHQGNRYPINETIWQAVGKQITHDADKIANWMHGRGMRDYFAFDVMVCEVGDVFHYYFLECNPRYNGASYPSNICERLGVKAWAHRFIPARTDFDFEVGDLAYDKKAGKGVIIVNWGAIIGGKLSVLFIAPTITEQANLEAKFRELVN